MEKVEALDLLEESWFFENLFHRRRRMLRCYSDPCTSSKFSQDVSVNDSCRESCNGSVPAPSLPTCIGRERKNNGGKINLNRQLSLQRSETTCSDHKIHDIQEKKPDGKIKSRGKSSSSRRNLLRTPLAAPMGTNELTQDNKNDPRMSKLIRQAVTNSPDILPPRHRHRHRHRHSHSISKAMSCNTNEAAVTRGRHSNTKRMLQKSHSDLAFQELQGFKDLGFTFDHEDLSPDVVNILPGLQGTKIDESKQEKVRRRPYLSEAWHVQCPPPVPPPPPPPTPPLPSRVSKNSAENMKAQIKFWARAVATNVRQEC